MQAGFPTFRRQYRPSGLLMVAALLSAQAGLALRAGAQSPAGTDEAFFAEKLYPALHTAQCVRCHNKSGVASESALEFPPEGTDKTQITAFGLSLLALVDREKPEQSDLFQKPTERIDHTGGERIKQGSNEERLLLAWVKYLAGLSDEEVRQAEAKIAAARARGAVRLTIRRLTHSQYDNTVRDLLDDQIQPAASFPKEDFIRGLKNQVEGQGISPLQAEAYGKAAERLARAAFRGGDQRGLVPGTPASPTDEQLAEKFVRQFGRKAFRRPLADSEVEQYRELHLREAERTQDFYAGAAIVIEAMLQSPHFLFRVERGGEHAQYELASRLSYFLWDTMPDESLFAAAERGELASRDEVEATARRMLEDSRARAALDEFLAQWMRFDRVLGATRDRRRYRQFNAEIAAAMAEETRRLFNHLVWNDQSFLEFFTADYTFVNSDLAKLYGLPPPAEEFGRVAYPADSVRSGVLGHGSFLVLTSKPSETSPTARGLFVRNQFLGQEVPPPPPGVNTVLPTVSQDAPLTNRQRLDVHLNSEACANCHRLIDPIGLGLEQFDAIGVFHEKMPLQFGRRRGGDNRGREPATLELELDTSGYIQGIEGSTFTTPRQLGRLLADSPACHKAIVKQLFRYAAGREETPADQPVLDRLLAKFQDSGFKFRELVVALVTSELFVPRSSD